MTQEETKRYYMKLLRNEYKFVKMRVKQLAIYEIFASVEQESVLSAIPED